MEEMKLKDSDKKRIIQYIKENELDYRISDGGIIRFHLIAEDDVVFYIHNYNEQYVMVKHEKYVKPGELPFNYFYYKNLQQVIEQLSFYDGKLPKIWWAPLKSTVDIGFNNEGYSDNWSKSYIINNKWSQLDWNEQYKYIVYNEERNIKVISPYNELHKTGYYDKVYTELNKLYFEVHPISLMEGNESFLVKVLINNEEVLKEYINYQVRRKKGLKLFLENLFNNNNPNVII